MTQRLRELLSQTTHQQLLDFVTRTLCAIQEHAIRATDLFLKSITPSTLTLTGQTPDIISTIGCFFHAQALVAWTRTSKRFYAIFNSPGLPHWRAAALTLDKFPASISSSLMHILRHVHRIDLSAASLASIEPFIQKHHSLNVALTRNDPAPEDRFKLFERIQCAHLQLSTRNAAPASPYSNARVTACSFEHDLAGVERFPALVAVEMRQLVKADTTFPSTLKALFIIRGAESLCLPKNLKFLGFMDLSRWGGRNSVRDAFRVQSLKGCASLTKLSLAGMKISLVESIVLPTMLTVLELCFETRLEESKDTLMYRIAVNWS